MRVLFVMALSMAVLASRVAGESQEYCDENGSHYSRSYSSEDRYSSQDSGSVDDDSSDNRYAGHSYHHGSGHNHGRDRGDETNNYNYNYYGSSNDCDNYDSASETQAPETIEWKSHGGSRYQSGQPAIGGLGNLLRLPGEIVSGVLGGGRGIGISGGFGFDNSVSGRGSAGSSGSFEYGLESGIGI